MATLGGGQSRRQAGRVGDRRATGGQIYGPSGEAHPGEWTARATDGWSEPGHDSSDDAMVALERYLYG